MLRDSYLLLDGLIYVKLLFTNTYPCYCINTWSKLLPNKYIELNKTKAIAELPGPGS